MSIEGILILAFFAVFLFILLGGAVFLLVAMFKSAKVGIGEEIANEIDKKTDN